MDACSQFYCYNTSKQVLFVDAEAFEDFSQAFGFSGSIQMFCWHTRENWTNISISGFLLRTLLYIFHQFVNIRSLRECLMIKHPPNRR